MSEDLNISDQEEPDGLVEFTTREEYVQCAYAAMSAVSELDTMLLSKKDAQRVTRIRRKCLRILDDCVGEMYDELFEEPDPED